jgi:hypothetical protein
MRLALAHPRTIVRAIRDAPASPELSLEPGRTSRTQTALSARANFRRGGRVVEGARLESVYTGNRIAGSNPAPSAILLS